MPTNPPLEYQNPTSVNLELDGEQVSQDTSTTPGTAIPIVREFVVPQESVSGLGPNTALLDIMSQCLVELKAIRRLLENDSIPELSNDADEASQSVVEEAIFEGVEEN